MINMGRRVSKISSRAAGTRAGTSIAMILVSFDVCLRLA